MLTVSGPVPRDVRTHAEVTKTCGALQEAYEEDPEYAAQRRSSRRHREAPVRRTRKAPISVSVSVRFSQVRAPDDAPAHPACDGRLLLSDICCMPLMHAALHQSCS